MTTTWRAAAVGAVLGAVLAFGPSCGSTSTTCDCPSGCCDEGNVCRPGTSAQACGTKGARCTVCTTSQTCSSISSTCTGGAATGGGAGSTGGGTASTGGGAASTGGGAATGGGSAAGGGTAAGGGAGLGAVVFNEICGAGQDFIELYNPSASAVNVSGYGVTDTQSDGGPKFNEALVFPAGTTVGPAGFLLVVMDRNTAGPTTDCLDGGVSSCFSALFNISNSNGENLYLLNPDSTVARTQNYPAGAAPSGQSYSRSPDGTGAFTALPVTPGARNVP